MNTSCKSALVILFFVFFTGISFGQSKKEQILQLQTKVDSLSQVLIAELLLTEQNNLKQQNSIDSLQRVLKVNQNDIFKIQSELDACKEDLNEAKQRCALLGVECEKIQLLKQNRIDSLQNALQLCQNNVHEIQNDLSICQENLLGEKQHFALLELQRKKIQLQLDSSMHASEIKAVVEFKKKLISTDAELAMELKSFEPELVLVKGGTFQMGSNNGHFSEKPVHSVTLSSFNIGKYEVTNAQWTAVIGSNAVNYSGCDNCPVEHVTWIEVQEYIQRLNAQTGKNYRLPTEAEWEYAARGGKASKGYTYSGSNTLSAVAWFSDNSGGNTHPVGTRKPNELGIYDMTGNVKEFCSDWHGPYDNSQATDPSGASSGATRVNRGGCYEETKHETAHYFRNTDRGGYAPEVSGPCGFRLVLP